MFTIKSNAEFISDIRALDDCLQNVRLNSIEIEREKSTICYNFICDKAVDDELKNQILNQCVSITSPIFSEVKVSVKKIVSNEQLICNEIYRFLSEKYPSVSIFLKPTDIICVIVGSVAKYTLRLSKDGQDYITKNCAIARLNEHLSKCFCSDFAGNTEIKEQSESASLLSEEVYVEELQKIEHRTIKVEDIIAIDDIHMDDLALYIEDVTVGDVTVCGTITEINERQTKNGKAFFVIHIDDTTGRLSGVYFSKKATYPKIKELAVGDAIIARGIMGEYNGRKSFTFDMINRCTFPTNFVKKDRYKKPVPKNYKLIFPNPASTVKIKSVFDGEDFLPRELVDNVYVVFDLETTGIEHMSNGITEIGAVKIINGRISEQFTTLVKPDYPITEENFNITGISKEMVKDAPKISMVIPDFIKFIDRAILVAQNADFDMKFLKRFAGAEEFEIKNKVMDTMFLSRELLPNNRKHDLQTIADHFGIVFHHHRALSDAYCTAEAFIELMKLKFKA